MQALQDAQPKQKDRPPIPEEAVRTHLSKVLRSDSFRGSVRMSAFLQHVVYCVLEDRHDELKETCIGVAVFGRDPSYDPKIDPVVRSEARRLRTKLEQYAATEGLRDPLRMSLPKGGYVPLIEALAGPKSDNSPVRVDQAEVLSSIQSDSRVQAKNISSTWWISVHQALKKHPVLAILFAALLGGAGFAGLRAKREATQPLLTRTVPLTSLPGVAFEPSVSPEGKKVAFVWDGGRANYDIYVAQEEGQPLRITTDPAQDLFPAWSPIGDAIAFIRSSPTELALMVLQFPGGQERKIAVLRSLTEWTLDPTQTTFRLAPSWTSDGKYLLLSQPDAQGGRMAIHAFDSQTGLSTIVTDPPTGAKDVQAAISPDGKLLAFIRTSSSSSSDVFVSPLLPSLQGRDQISSRTRQLTFDHADIQGLNWAGNDAVIISSNRSGPYNLWRQKLAGAPVPLLTSGESALEPSASRDGLTVAYTDSNVTSNIVRLPIDVDRRTGVQTVLPVFVSSKQSNSAQFAPDGKHIAFTSDRTGSWELWMASSSGEGISQLTTFRTSMVGTPRWANNGRDIAFDARPDGHSQVFRLSIELPGHPIRITSGGTEEKQPSWSQDGEWIYMNSNRSGHPEVWKTSVRGIGTPVEVCDCDARDLQESLDGVLYFSINSRLYRISTPKGLPELVPGLEQEQMSRLWTLIPHGVLYVHQDRDGDEIRLYEVKSGTSRRLVVLPFVPDTQTPGLSWSQSSVLLTRREGQRSNIMLSRLQTK